MTREEKSHNIDVRGAVKRATTRVLIEKLNNNLDMEFDRTVNLYASREAYKLVDRWLNTNNKRLQKQVAKACRESLGKAFKTAWKKTTAELPRRVRRHMARSLNGGAGYIS